MTNKNPNCKCGRCNFSSLPPELAMYCENCGDVFILSNQCYVQGPSVKEHEFTIEYQLLQLGLSVIGGDKITIGLIHWDGYVLRRKFSLKAVHKYAEHLPNSCMAVIENIKFIAENVEKAAKIAVPDTFLSEVFYAKALIGSTLFWSKIVEDTTKNAEAHFQELKNNFVELKDG